MEQKTEASQAVGERAQFEREMLRLSIIDDEGLEQSSDGSYIDEPAQTAWSAWQARTALKAQPAPTDPLSAQAASKGNADSLSLAEAAQGANKQVLENIEQVQGDDSARLDAQQIEANAAAFELEIGWVPNRIITDKTPWGWRYRRAAMQEEFMEFLARASAETGGVKS